MNLPNAEFESLLAEYAAGTITDERLERLAQVLRDDEAARDAFVRAADLHASLAVDESLWAAPPTSAAAAATPAPIRIARRLPRMAAAFALLLCGLVVGFVSATLVWASNSPAPKPLPRHVLPLTDGSFEANVTPEATEVPLRFGVWGGDYARIVTGAEQGVTPADGQHMARFLRSDNARTPRGGDTKAAQLWQCIDLAPFKQQLATGRATVDITAAFATATAGSNARVGVGLYAFNGNVADAQTLWAKHRQVELAAALKSERPATAPGQWQTVKTQLALPREASFVIVELRVIEDKVGPAGYIEFPGHYVDAVHLSLTETP